MMMFEFQVRTVDVDVAKSAESDGCDARFAA
jgi:hypothetical protein